MLFLVLFFYVCWPYGAKHYADARDAKEIVQIESLLALDPLVSISTAIAGRIWVWSLVWTLAILALCLVIPRGFCSYLCPMGTVIDLCDWLVNRRITRFKIAADGWWIHLKYYLLAAVLVSSVFGVLLSGFVAAIPVVTRGLAFIATPLQIGLARNWYQVPPIGPGQVVSIVLFVLVLALGLLRPRFWCCYVCPSGAVFSLANRLRLTQRKVTADCVRCSRCIEICPFDSIRTDFTTRTADCTFCQICGGVCPAGAIQFVSRTAKGDFLVDQGELQPDHRPSPSRRSFLGSVLGGVAAALSIRHVFGADVDGVSGPPVRPPGSLPERTFLATCIRCGQCYQACPNSVLQPVGFEQGVEGLWTPKVAADWAGCDVTCNNCGQVCPTGAIRALPLAEKRVARMGLAVVDEVTCLPYAGADECQLCVDECMSAGYKAIEFVRVGVETDGDGMPIEGTGYAAPTVLADACVGCGLCQMRCYLINVKQKHLLSASAIVVQAGPGKEDRIATGSYIGLHDQRSKQRDSARKARMKASGAKDTYLPDFLK